GPPKGGHYILCVCRWRPPLGGSLHSPNDRHHDIRPVTDQRVHAPLEQTHRILVRVDRPDLHGKIGAMRRGDETRVDDVSSSGPPGHLIAAIRRPRAGPPAPTSI